VNLPYPPLLHNSGAVEVSHHVARSFTRSQRPQRGDLGALHQGDQLGEDAASADVVMT
jgi:hypothetical protein